ncbi:hypothetical protein O6H91_Y322600 [Diphasiastrum complanatum]|nr:hypothetical protein O6H91_Y322600 [Diphasiastrum complanatum]
MVDIQRLNLYLWDNDSERYEYERFRFGNRLSKIFKRPLGEGEYAVVEFIQNDICVQKANEACQILVQRMSNPYIAYSMSPGVHAYSMSPGLDASENFHKLYYDTRRALLLLMKVTKAEPEPLAFLDDCRKIKFKFLPLSDLWILSHSGGSKGVHVELTVKPIVSAPGRVAINFVTLFVKPTGPDLELITELKLSFAPFTVHQQSIVLVEAEVGSPDDLYDISMTKGVTRSATTS